VGLNPRAQLRQLLAERRPVYEAVAVHVVDTSDRPVEQVVDDVAALASRP
jgi:shikimate kinase